MKFSQCESRRQFLKTTTATAGLLTGSALWPVRMPAMASPTRTDMSITDPDVRRLVETGLDAARSAGAQYADVRMSHQRQRKVGSVRGLDEQEDQMVGVRALVNGYWGFASGALWSTAELAALGQRAVQLARANAMGKPRVVDLAPVQSGVEGHWTMPVTIDPFDVPIVEIQDYLNGMYEKYRSLAPPPGFVLNGATFWKQDKAFGSTEGRYVTQTLYNSTGQFELMSTQGVMMMKLPFLTPTGCGWELYRDRMIQTDLERMVEKYNEDTVRTPWPVDVGRYDVVIDAASMGRLISATLGVATELDRSMGYEANAGGTSYLNDPFEMTDSFRIGSSALHIDAGRTDAGGVATARWDDEAVETTQIPLIEQGILKQFQTTREGAGWMQQSSAARKGAFVSTGCAYARSASDEPLPMTANLSMRSAAEAMDYDKLVKLAKTGIAFEDLSVTIDFQQSSGIAWGNAYRITNGHKVEKLIGAGILFKAVEFWKNLSQPGGKESRERFGYPLTKGQPPQLAFHSVTTPPALFRNMTVIDVRRKV